MNRKQKLFYRKHIKPNLLPVLGVIVFLAIYGIVGTMEYNTLLKIK